MSAGGSRGGRLPPLPRLGDGLRGVDRRQWPGEALAGVSLVALAVPMNIGYATIVGLPPEVGIYVSVVPLVAFSLLTSSRRLVAGPDAAIVALLAAGLIPVVGAGVTPADAALGVALLTGVFLLLAWALRLGALVRFLSKAVLTGFIAGLAIEILTSQVHTILAVDIDGQSWLAEAVELVLALPQASWASVAIGVGTILSVRLLGRLTPQVPAALVALAGFGALVAWLEPEGVEVLGEAAAGLPPLTFPLLPLDAWVALAPLALAISVVIVAEGLAIAKDAAQRNGERIEPNQEILAFGVANIAASASGAMPIGPSASRTAALRSTATSSQLAMVVSAGMALLAGALATDLIAAIPSAALAGVIANAVVRLIEVPTLRRLARVRRSDFLIAMGCAASVLLLGPLPALVLAALVAAFDMVRRAAAVGWDDLGAPPEASSSQHFSADSDDVLDPALRVLRPNGPLFFANAETARDTLLEVAEDERVGWVVIDLEAVSDIDPTAAEALEQGLDALTGRGVVVAFSRARTHERALLEAYGLLDGARVFTTNHAAVEAFARERPDA